MKRFIMCLVAIWIAGLTTNVFAQKTIEQMSDDILNLPGMNKFAVMCVSEPEQNEPYYTFKVGENQEDHFVTLVWFHIYTKPEYEIKVYDIITDSDYPAKEWLVEKGYAKASENKFVQDADWVQIKNVKLPEINTSVISSGDVQRINEEIRVFYDEFMVEEQKAIEGEEAGHGPSSSYSCFQNGDILSIVIQYDGAGFGTPNYRYKAFNLNISTGQQINNDALLSHSRVSTTNIQKVIKEANEGKFKFTEGKIDFEDYQQSIMYLENDSLKMYVKVVDLPFGSGTAFYSMSVQKYLSESKNSQESKSTPSQELEISPLQVTSDTGISSPEKGVFKIYNNVNMGILVRVENGKVYLSFDKEKLFGPRPSEEAVQNLKSSEYVVKGLEKNCVGIFVADIGQDTNPVLCMLLEDGTVQVVSIFDVIYGSKIIDFVAGSCLSGFHNIISFRFGGGGAYEQDGETIYSYVTIYAIDKAGKEYEIELN